MWQSKLSVAEKTTKMNALVWNKGRWSLHLFPLSKSNRRLIDSAKVRFLRRILKISAAYISRVSHVRVCQRCNTYIFSTFSFRAQLRWLGHILRKLENAPLRKVPFEPNSLYPPRPRSLTFRRARRKRGRPHADWAGTLFSEIYNLTREDRNSVAAIALDLRRFQAFVERLCSLFDRT